MSQQNYLEQNGLRFSKRVMAAARDGRFDARPLLTVLERALVVAGGVATVLNLEATNTVRGEVATPDDGLEPPLSSGTMYSLLELARFSAEALGNEIERVADWADKRCAGDAQD